MAGPVVQTHAQLPASKGRVPEGLQLALAQRGVDGHQGEGLEDVDLTDLGTGDTGLVGDRAHDRAGHDTVTVTDLDAVDGPRAVVLLTAPAPVATTLLAAPPGAVPAALEGGRHEAALVVHGDLTALAAPGGLALTPLRTLVAHSQRQQGGGQVPDAHVQLPGLVVHQGGVHPQPTTLVARGGPLQELGGTVRGDVGGGGQGDLLQAGAGQALDLAELGLLLGGQEGHGLPVAPGAPGTPDAVHVGLGLAGDVEVDHQADTVHVQAAGGHVGGHQHVQGAGAQALDQALTLTLGDVPGDGGGLDAPAGQLEGHVLGRGLGAHEHDGGLGLGDGQDPGDRTDLVAEGHHGVGLVDGVHRGGLGGDLDLDRLSQVLTGDGLDRGRHGGGEQGRATLLRQGGGNGLHVLGEAHAQHLVGLVQHEVAHRVQAQGTLVNEVDNAAGGAHHHLGPVAQRTDLRAVGGAAVDGDDLQAAGAVGHVGNGVGALEGELAGGGQDQGLDDALAGVHGVEQRQAEGGGLTGTGLGHAHHVAPGQEDRDGLLLDRGGGHEAHVGHGLEQVRGQAEVGEGGLGLTGLILGLVPGVQEGGVAVDVVLDGLGVALVGVVPGVVLRVGLGHVALDVVVLVLVLHVLGVLGGVGGGGGGEVLGGAGRGVGDGQGLGPLSLLGLLLGGRGLLARGLGVEESVQAQGRGRIGVIAHGVIPDLAPEVPVGPTRSVGEGRLRSTLAAPPTTLATHRLPGALGLVADRLYAQTYGSTAREVPGSPERGRIRFAPAHEASRCRHPPDPRAHHITR